MASEGAPKPYTGQNYEKDPRWSAVDDYTLSHLHGSDRTPDNDVLQKIHEASLSAGLPDIAVPRTLGKFIGLQCRIGKVKHALEVGTLGGYSATWLASTNPDMVVTTVEISEKHAGIAKANFEKAGVSDRVELILGSGLDVLPKLLEEVKAGKREPYGFCFIDADKPSGWTYFDLAVQMGAPGMCIVVDNVVRKGLVASEDPEVQQRPQVQGARVLVEKIGKDDRVESVVMQTVGEKNYDGFLMAVVK